MPSRSQLDNQFYSVNSRNSEFEKELTFCYVYKCKNIVITFGKILWLQYFSHYIDKVPVLFFFLLLQLSLLWEVDQMPDYWVVFVQRKSKPSTKMYLIKTQCWHELQTHWDGNWPNCLGKLSLHIKFYTWIPMTQPPYSQF